VLQKSKVASVRIFGETLKREVIDDSDDLSRVTEVAYEFCVGNFMGCIKLGVSGLLFFVTMISLSGSAAADQCDDLRNTESRIIAFTEIINSGK